MNINPFSILELAKPMINIKLVKHIIIKELTIKKDK